MLTNYLTHRLFLIFFMISLVTATTAQTNTRQTVDGVEVYLGIVPAEMVRGHPREHPESTMHGGVATGQSHLMVALFDAKTGMRITDARVNVRLSVRGGHLQEVVKQLEPMLIAGSQTYGQYFPMLASEPYQIEVTITLSGRDKPVVANFEWSKT